MNANDPAPPASYFPLDERPFRMTAGLHRLGHDFGNGATDGLHFQRDRTAPEYRVQKARVLSAHPQRLSMCADPERSFAVHEVYEWMRRQLDIEHGLTFASLGAQRARGRWLDLSLSIQEDFAIVRKAPHAADELILLSVCFPSGWEPDKLLGAGFDETHAPVPGFGDLHEQRGRLIHAMIHRGPYVRFVWSVTADARLDHHPVHAPRDDWESNSRAFLRVERQVTIPFPQSNASLFLIRTYVYPVESLSEEKRNALLVATAALPPAIQSYKGITPQTLRILEACAKARP